MSHYTLIVTGEDPESQLAPYDENLQVEPYKDRVDLDEVGRAIAWFSEHPDHITAPLTKEQVEAARAAQTEGQIAVLTAFMGSQAGYDDDGFFVWTTYNPRAKWDWYLLGGRWSGYFPLKTPRDPDAPVDGLGQPGVGMNVAPPSTVDQGRRGDLDLDRMRRERGEAAGKHWDVYQEVVADLPAVRPWSEFVDHVKAERMTINEARSLYGAQPRVAAFQTPERREEFGWDVDHDELSVDRAAYVELARARAVPAYALLHDGRWIAPGRMGMFAVSTDTPETEHAYLEVANQIIDGLPADTLLSLFDLHI